MLDHYCKLISTITVGRFFTNLLGQEQFTIKGLITLQGLKPQKDIKNSNENNKTIQQSPLLEITGPYAADFSIFYSLLSIRGDIIISTDSLSSKK